MRSRFQAIVCQSFRVGLRGRGRGRRAGRHPRPARYEEGKGRVDLRIPGQSAGLCHQNAPAPPHYEDLVQAAEKIIKKRRRIF